LNLQPEVLSAIADLELVARVTVEGTVSGLHPSPFHGYSAEFSQYRHYRPGDDLKYLDWRLFARTDRLYTKQYRETTNMLAELAIDVSGSMSFRGHIGISKFEYARLLAAALSHLVTVQGDAVGLVAYADTVRQFLPGRAGQSHLRAVLVALARLQPSGTTAAAAALRRAAELLKRRGLLVLLSDLYDEDEAVERELRRAVSLGHEVAVFHILTRDEVDLSIRGDVELEDLETGETVLTSAAAARSGYQRRFGQFLERWRTRCASYGIDYTRVTTDMPLDAALRGYLLRRSARPLR
jgi:uncharacterized protein (DUF58 family)